MNVSLTPQLEKMIASKVKAGMYQTASEVVREALRLMKERDKEQAKLREDVLAGLRQVQQGDYTEYDETSTARLAAEINSRGRKRFLKEQRARRA